MKKKDITLLNFNLMYGVVNKTIDFQKYPPLGLLSIAASLEQEGYSVDFRDYQTFISHKNGSPFILKDIVPFIDDCSDIIGISCMSNLLPFAILASREIKEIYSNTTIILGGVGPTSVAKEIIKTFPWIDFVAYGEAENSIVRLMDSLKNNTNIYTEKNIVSGFYYKINNKVFFKQQERITDLDSLPLPAYHLIDTKEYDAAFSVLSSRGCPFKCTFCTETNHWKNKVVFKSIDRVIDEIRSISINSSKKVFLFQDDQITINRERALMLFKRIQLEFPDFYWKAFVRVDLVDEELLQVMKESGCIQVRFGIESGSNEILKAINKGFTIEEAFKSVSLALKYIPSVHVSFIWGYPFETINQCKETMKWIKSFHKEGATVLNFLLSPLPNSTIYKQYNGPLDFNDNIMANFNASGGENFGSKKITILEHTQYMFDFIKKYPKIFPGFFIYDYKNNIKPKMKIVYKKRLFIFRNKKKIILNRYHEYSDTDV